MINKKKVKILVGDFETTVYKGQTHTEVWASAVVPLYTEDVIIFHSINETWEYLKKLKQNIIIYYHNLKFDGSFWLSFLLADLHMVQATRKIGSEINQVEWLAEKEMKDNTFKYSISEMGQWYSITIKYNGYIIEIRDSLKLLPFSVRKIGESFGTKHKKLDMEYEGLRYAGCEITDKEKQYIANDVFVVKEALEIMFNKGHNKLTIGSCCLEEYKRIVGKDDWETLFPDLTQIEIDKSLYGVENADEYIRNSYKGGWCYLVKGKELKRYHNGTTADVNSLYPSMMHSESGNYYPTGKPVFWKGNYIPDKAKQENKYFFVRVRCRFKIKNDMLPFIQIKRSMIYKGTEMLETSDYYNEQTGTYHRFYYDLHGNLTDTIVTLTLTQTDYELFLKHYDVYDFEILDGCWFFAEIGLFDEYINHYKEIKMNSKGALRELAKLFLNNLYGKFATNPDSSFKLAYVKDDGVIGFYPVFERNKKAGYIAVGSAVTSYARNFTITAAQLNYHGVDKHGFIYADTDSIHCDLQPTEITGIKVDDNNFCCWKLEAQWDVATFTRQKTYIEHVTHENLKPIDKPYYNIKCAGMPAKCKELFRRSMMQELPKEDEKLTEEEKQFITTKRTLADFKQGLIVPSKLLPKRIQGGILLTPTTYEMR